MISVRLPQSLKPVTDEHFARAVISTGVVAAVALTVTAGLAVARSGPLERTDAAKRVAQETGGDWSDAGLRRLTAEMDPAVLSIASRFDPGQPIEAAPGWRFAQDLSFLQAEGAEAQRINSAIPFTMGAVEPAAPFFLQARTTAERKRAVRCLANAIYYEAALEPIEGQQAVAQVVVNRVRDPNFPKSVCGVVYEGWERITGCQFSFTCDGALVRTPVPDLWEQARRVAEAALSGYVRKDVGAATHYHADYVAPYWAPGLVKIAQIGTHIFYRWPGLAGTPQALTAVYKGGELRLSEAVLTGRAARPKPVEVAALDGAVAKTVATIDPATGAARTRVTATLTPEPYGRRTASPEEIARINALLEERFPSKPEAPAQSQASAAPAAAAPVATAETSVAG
jgi:spore germination cell wall hydrolase CwlJ-like protein